MIFLCKIVCLIINFLLQKNTFKYDVTEPIAINNKYDFEFYIL